MRSEEEQCRIEKIARHTIPGKIEGGQTSSGGMSVGDNDGWAEIGRHSKMVSAVPVTTDYGTNLEQRQSA